MERRGKPETTAEIARARSLIPEKGEKGIGKCLNMGINSLIQR